jgi:hypothetical protein
VVVVVVVVVVVDKVVVATTATRVQMQRLKTEDVMESDDRGAWQLKVWRRGGVLGDKKVFPCKPAVL